MFFFFAFAQLENQGHNVITLPTVQCKLEIHFHHGRDLTAKMAEIKPEIISISVVVDLKINQVLLELPMHESTETCIIYC